MFWGGREGGREGGSERERERAGDCDARINTTRLTAAKNLRFFVKPCFKIILLEYFNEKRKRL